MVIGGGVVATAKMMPSEWHKPIVESIILPGHAQASDENVIVIDLSGNVIDLSNNVIDLSGILIDPSAAFLITEDGTSIV
jgi:hypothetical protein